jgi:hypothetical protein
MRKVIMAAVVIAVVIFFGFGYLLYKTGEAMTTMYRCGCYRDRDY